jgi:7-keto-8-aminopelargonate synthetase-like enzyme
MGTLGKAFGTAGAFVAGSRVLTEFLTNRARTFIFTTASPPAIAAAALAALEIAEQEPERRERVRANARRLREGLGALGYAPAGPPDGHIVPVVIGENDATMEVGAALRAAGFLVGAVRPPTVPPGTSRLRITVSAAHSPVDINALLDALERALPRSSSAQRGEGARGVRTR